MRVRPKSLERRPLKRFDIFSPPYRNNGLNDLRFITNRAGLSIIYNGFQLLRKRSKRGWENYPRWSPNIMEIMMSHCAGFIRSLKTKPFGMRVLEQLNNI